MPRTPWLVYRLAALLLIAPVAPLGASPSPAPQGTPAAAAGNVSASVSGYAGGTPLPTLQPVRRPLFCEEGRWVPYALGAALLVATDRHTQPAITRALSGPAVLRASRAVGTLGTPQAYLGTPLLLYAFGGRHGKQTATCIINALVTSGLVTEATKVLVGRRRPDESGGLGDLRGPSLAYESFPSGHASAAFAVATVLAAQYPRYRVPFYALAAAVAASRVLQNRHFPSDVFVGAGIGIAAGQQAVHGGCNLLGFRF